MRNKMFAVSIALLLVGLLATATLAQGTPQPQEKQEKKATLQLSGEVVSVDGAGNSLTVRGKDEASSTFKVNAGTQILRDGKPIKLGDLAAGDKVTVTYEKQAQSNVAVMIGVMAPGKA